MTNVDSRPQFALYVARHTDFELGGRIETSFRRQWGTEPYRQIVGDGGIDVLPRHARAPSAMPPIDWNGSAATAVVVLLDRLLAAQRSWIDYVRELAEEADARGFACRVFPVAMEPEVLDALGDQLPVQVLRWAEPATTDSDSERHLIRELLHQFCRMLRYRMRRKPHQPATLDGYLKEKVRIFISYRRDDQHGQKAARCIHDWVHNNSDLDTFFDVVSIPSGVRFPDVIYDAIRDSVMVACYSDSYSSSHWCRREVIEAKRHGIPMIVLDCLHDMDPRLFPYLGNVPVVRVDPEQDSPWTERVVTMLLEEVFRDLLWRCRVAPLEHKSEVAFTSRKPELCLLAALSKSHRRRPSVVYPGPSIGAEEEKLFADIDPSVQLHTFDDWARRHA